MLRSHLERGPTEFVELKIWASSKSSPGFGRALCDRDWQIRRGICKLVREPVDLCQNLGIAHSSSHFQVELKSCELFQRFCTSLAPRPKPAQEYWLSHGTCIQPGLVQPRRCPAELMAFTGAILKSGSLVEHWVDDWSGSATTRSDFGRLLSWRCTLGALFEWLSQRAIPNPGELSELAQIFNSTNSAGQISKCDLSIKSCEFFQRFCTALAPRPKLAQKYELSHGTCIQPGAAPPRRCPAELMAFTARGHPEIWQIGRALGRQPVGVRHKSFGLVPTSVLKMYARRSIWMWLSQRALPNPGELFELAQIYHFYKFGRAPF